MTSLWGLLESISWCRRRAKREWGHRNTNTNTKDLVECARRGGLKRRRSAAMSALHPCERQAKCMFAKAAQCDQVKARLSCAHAGESGELSSLCNPLQIMTQDGNQSAFKGTFIFDYNGKDMQERSQMCLFIIHELGSQNERF